MSQQISKTAHCIEDNILVLYIFLQHSWRICASVNCMHFFSPDSDSSGSNTTKIVAGVMVIGSLTVGLLFALLCFRKRNHTRGEYSFNIHSKDNK